MSATRFLPDLLVMAGALFAGPKLLGLLRQQIETKVFKIARTTIRAGSGLLIGGLGTILLQALEVPAGFQLLMVSGLAFAYGDCVILATGIAYAAFRTPLPTRPERRRILTLASGAAMAAPPVFLGYGLFIGRRQFHLKEVDLPIPGLPPDLNGIRIAHLSDIHLSPFLSRADLRWCVDMANETRPHLAAVTGDLITGLRDSIDDCLEELRRLRSDAGTYGCNGNHELYIGAEAYTAEQAGRLGMQFLRSRSATLKFGSATVNLAGIDHQYRNAARIDPNLLRAGEFNLLLNHNPAVFPEIANQGWDLTLSGHMHGGQINLELANANWNVAQFRTPYVYGAFREGRSSMYVTRGIGTIGVPVRLGAPPEVALIRLRRA